MAYDINCRIINAEQSFILARGRDAERRSVPPAAFQVLALDDALIVSCPAWPHLFYNRIFGGCHWPVLEPRLDDAIRQMDEISILGARIEVTGTNTALAAALRARNFEPDLNATVKMIRDVAPVSVRAEVDLPIRRLDGEEEFHQAAELCCEVFDLPAYHADLFVDLGADPGNHSFGAFDGGTLVAVGFVSMFGDTAYLGPAATRNGYRNRGLQAALIAARIEAAARSGATLLTGDAALAPAGGSSSSLNNFRRQGFRIAYEKILYRRPAA